MAEIGTNLRGNKIYLKKMGIEDLDFLYSVENNPDFWYVSETKTPYSKWDLKQYLENSAYDIYTNKELRLIICDINTDKAIGTIDLFDFHPLHNRCGVGILVCPEYVNKGIATEALLIVKEYAFNVLLLNQLWCMIDETNAPSIALFEKSKFIKCGKFCKWKRSSSGYNNVLVYQCFEI